MNGTFVRACVACFSSSALGLAAAAAVVPELQRDLVRRRCGIGGVKSGSARGAVGRAHEGRCERGARSGKMMMMHQRGGRGRGGGIILIIRSRKAVFNR